MHNDSVLHAVERQYMVWKQLVMTSSILTYDIAMHTAPGV